MYAYTKVDQAIQYEMHMVDKFFCVVNNIGQVKVNIMRFAVAVVFFFCRSGIRYSDPQMVPLTKRDQPRLCNIEYVGAP